jgi:hypothetical protein
MKLNELFTAKLSLLIENASTSDHVKHWVDVGLSAGTIGSCFAWLNSELPLLTMWLTFIGAALSIIWWIYRFFTAIRHETKRRERESKL